LANLAAVIKLMPSVLYNYHIVKQLKDEIKNLKHVILRYRIRFAAKNAQLNGMIETMENYHPTSGPEPSTFSKNTSVIDFAIQLAFPLICGAIFGYLGGPSFVGVSLALLGVVIGSCVGAVLSHWRRN
jgi:hypothetical protein